MDSSLIGKVEKAKRYAQEPERIRFKAFVLRFQGDHRAHELTYREGVWHCTCAYFVKRETCSHSMAMEPAAEARCSPPGQLRSGPKARSGFEAQQRPLLFLETPER